MNEGINPTLIQTLAVSWDPAVLIDPSGRILKANKALARLLDTDPENLEGIKCLSLMKAPENPEDIRRAMEKLITAGLWTGTLDIFASSGESRTCDVRLVPIDSGGKETSGYLAFLRPVGDASCQDHRLAQVQSIVSKANLAGGVVHHFNNILATIILQSELIRLKEKPFAEVRKGMTTIVEVAQKGSDTLRKFQEFRYSDHASKGHINVGPALESRLELLNKLAPSGTQIKMDLAVEPLEVFCREEDLHTLLTNLVINAWEALPDHRGSVSVRVGRPAVTPDAPIWDLGKPASRGTNSP